MVLYLFGLVCGVLVTVLVAGVVVVRRVNYVIRKRDNQPFQVVVNPRLEDVYTGLYDD